MTTPSYLGGQSDGGGRGFLASVRRRALAFASEARRRRQISIGVNHMSETSTFRLLEWAILHFNTEGVCSNCCTIFESSDKVHSNNIYHRAPLLEAPTNRTLPRTMKRLPSLGQVAAVRKDLGSSVSR